VPATRTNAEKILARLKGLAEHLQPDEEPLAAFPVIWDNGSASTLCDVVITNQRIIGFYFRSFPREKLFIDSLSLSHIKSITFRQESYEPVFRELLISEDHRQVYIRAPRKKIEGLYAALRAATDQYGSTGARAQEHIDEEQEAVGERLTSSQSPQQTVYGRQEIQTPFETSILVILLLFVGGIVLEIVGVRLWSVTHDAQIGFPLCLAGFIAVGASIWLRRKRQ
jgi:hypothetical protein